MSSFSPTFQVNFKNFCGNLVLKNIADLFDGAGVQCSPPPPIRSEGQRRSLVKQYWENIDWNDDADKDKVLQALTIGIHSATLPQESREQLRQLCANEGLRIENNKVMLHTAKHSGIKNLIFASIGYKPEIVLIDATTNDIKITKNEEYCLVYDRGIPSHGLLWSDLITWWIETGKSTSKEAAVAAKELYVRLDQSLAANEPERLVMRNYFTSLRQRLGDKLPAIVPQVYLHYDPYTFRERGTTGPLERQRMDFLLLLNGGQKIVLEIDGKQHYSESDRASPTLYAKMVTEDRRIKLRGYEVYRFGGQEFVDKAGAGTMLDAFFLELFKRCGYLT